MHPRVLRGQNRGSSGLNPPVPLVGTGNELLTCTREAKAEVSGSNTTSGKKMNCPGGIWLKVQHSGGA